MGSRQGNDFIAGFEDAPGAGDDLLPRLRERHVIGLPLDELHAEVFLELLQLRGQRRLADEAALGGAPEVAAIGHRYQVAQVFQLDVRHGRSDIWRLSIL